MSASGPWKTFTILDVCSKIMDYRGRTPKKLGLDWGGGSIPAISARNVKMGRIDFTEEFYTGSDVLYRRWMTQGDMEAGDSLITTEAPLGNVAAVPDASKYILSQRTVLLRPQADLVDRRFFTQILQSPQFQRSLSQNASGSTALGIQRKRLEKIAIPVPSLPEQRAIATAIDDATRIIDSLQRLVAKKRAIEQGMMQQLLTGSIRLPGFVGVWERARLGDVLTVRHGKSQRGVEDPSGPYPILATGGQIGWARSALYSKPSVLIGRKGTIDRPQYQDRPFWTVDTLFYTEISANADPRFLYYLFLTIDWRSMNEASGVPSLSSQRVEGVSVSLPSLAEQVAIRELLDDAGHQISTLRTQLAKYREIKTGMMQQLLTGRVRLPSEAA